MTPRQNLIGLLFSPGTGPDGLDALLSSASQEIVVLRAALINANDLKSLLAAKQTELDQRNATLSYSHKAIAEQDKEIMRLRAELVTKNEELARLRPPEPRFRVGQVVVRVECGNAYTIRHSRCNMWSGKWEYSNCRVPPNDFTQWTAEAMLRALTDEEK